MFEELKQRQSVMWGNGPYQRITETISDVHELVASRLDPREGEQVLDLACGTGAVAERLAESGAEVTGADLAPALIDTARERAAELGLDIDYRVEDCERLTLGDATFDGVTSTFGIMFAPDQEAAARELARVTRPGGRIVLANWTPDGGVGKMFAVVSAFQPAPPPSRPVAWGEEESVRVLLGEWYELGFEQHVSTLEVASGEAMWELFSTSFGPVKTLAEARAGPPRRVPPRVGRVLRGRLPQRRAHRPHARLPARERHAHVAELRPQIIRRGRTGPHFDPRRRDE